MSIVYTTGDIFQSNADCLVNPVNCEGRMGKGLAYQFKLRFPENNQSYMTACKDDTLHVGTIHCYRDNGITIINFPTKNKWSEKSSYKYIETGLDAFIDILPTLDVNIIAIPQLGCGNGGLNWTDVKSLIENKLEVLKDKYDFIIFELSKCKAGNPPKLNVLSLALLKIKMGLENSSELRIQETVRLVNLILKESIFYFRTNYRALHDFTTAVTLKDIKEYQEFYGIEDMNTLYNMIYRTICCESVDKFLDKLNPAINKAVNYMNNVDSDDEIKKLIDNAILNWEE